MGKVNKTMKNVTAFNLKQKKKKERGMIKGADTESAEWCSCNFKL